MTARALATTTALALAAATAAAAPAAAAGPDTVRTDIDAVFVETDTCPFPLVAAVTGQVVQRTFRAPSGEPVRIHRHIHVSGTLTNPESGIAYGAPQNVLFSQDVATGTRTQTGLRFAVTVPGLGRVLLDAGRVVIAPDGTIESATGPHDLLSGDTRAFCSAIA